MTQRQSKARRLGVSKVVVACSLPIPLEGRLRQHANDNDVSLSSVVSAALEEHLDRVESPQ